MGDYVEENNDPNVCRPGANVSTLDKDKSHRVAGLIAVVNLDYQLLEQVGLLVV